VQRSSQIVATDKPTPNFLQAGCPSCRPTNSVKALKGTSTASDVQHLTPAIAKRFQRRLVLALTLSVVNFQVILEIIGRQVIASFSESPTQRKTKCQFGF